MHLYDEVNLKQDRSVTVIELLGTREREANQHYKFNTEIVDANPSNAAGDRRITVKTRT